MIEILINAALLIILPLLFIGLINRVKSLWGGRQGPSIMQPVRDFLKLMKKGEVISTTSSFIFKIAPSITFASIILAGLIVPMAGGRSILSFNADFIFFAYILATGKFFAIIGAMDTGSSFEGMGASREAVFSSLVEPAFFIVIASIGILGNVSTFEGLMRLSGGSGELKMLILMLGAGTLFIMLLVEGCRVPVDDPNTHLELTMIHEVMVLDNSGPDMGIIMYASAMKMIIISSIIANMVIPESMAFGLSLASYLAVLLVLAVIIGTIEAIVARLRMSHVPQFLFYMTAISVIILSIIVLTVSGGMK